MSRCYNGQGENHRGSHEGEEHRAGTGGPGEGHRSGSSGTGQRAAPPSRHDQRPTTKRTQAKVDKNECSKRLAHSRALLKTLRRRSTLVKRLCAKEVRHEYRPRSQNWPVWE